jgi:ectoine hydroxylase-related dioxygenase (phytanoyl-CoA dioxygenase family)
VQAEDLELAEHGAQIFRQALTTAQLAALEAVLADVAPDQAGVRLHGLPGLDVLLDATSGIGRIAADALGQDCFPVRAILFDKTASTNWALGWHQDRTIAVRARQDVPGFGPWTTKQDLTHAAAPISILSRMVTLRIHLDAVPEANAPLLVALGSHRRGTVAEDAIGDVMARTEPIQCLAERGDIWAYATLILHASAASRAAGHRRVLQVDYAHDPLPGGLEWLGV